MRAEDLNIAPVITWWNQTNPWNSRPLPDNLLVRFDGNRFYHLMAGEDEREGGALLYFHLFEPIAISGASREYPSPLAFAEMARNRPKVWLDAEKPFWWDVPVWIAHGQVDSIGIANNHMCRSQMYENEAWGKPRDANRLPPPLGNGYWTQEIYYHILNCGLRIPPSAGSASGVLPNPVGYNRIYVHTGDKLDYNEWWNGLTAGRSFVTNGPLLLVEANGKLPGETFSAKNGKEISLSLTAKLTSRDPIKSIEIIRNGQVDRRFSSAELRENDSLGDIRFTESGWFLIRAFTDNDRTFRFASTAPFYVEIGENKHRISRSSAQFFLDWVRERMPRVKLDRPNEREAVVKYHLAAERFWRERLKMANAD
jgi:hypothetical protein